MMNKMEDNIMGAIDAIMKNYVCYNNIVGAQLYSCIATTITKNAAGDDYAAIAKYFDNSYDNNRVDNTSMNNDNKINNN